MRTLLRFALLSALLPIALPLCAQTGEVILDGSASPTAGVVIRATSATKSDVTATLGSSTTAGFVVFNSANAELLRVRNDGVIALGGVTASQWDPVVSPAIEYKNTAIAFGESTDIHFLSNAYYPPPHPGSWRYKVAERAADYYMFRGVHFWRVSAPGVADAAINWVEAMNLSSAGNLGIGISNTAAQARIQLAGAPTALSMTTSNSDGFGVHFRDTTSQFAYRSGVLMDMTGNSTIRVSNLQIGDQMEPEISSTAPNVPLYLNRDTGHAVHIGGGTGRSLITAQTTDANPVLTLKVGSANGYYPTLLFQSEDGTRRGSVIANTVHGVVIQSLETTAAATFVLSPQGNVGIGTVAPAPGMKLDVVGNAQFSGTVTGGNIQAKYQDVAEWVPATDNLTPGTVVVLDREAHNTVRASSSAYDTTVAGVVSEQPGLLLGEAGSDKEMVATTGRVRIRVDASRHAIAIGDLLVTSGKPGVASKSIPVDIGGIPMHRPGTIIGKALEPLAGGEGYILVLLSLQ